MKIIRAAREGNFTIIPNETLRDRNLSYRAAGLLAELLSHDDGWETNADRIAGRAIEGRDAIRKALNELREHRYMVTKKFRAEKGRWEWSHFIYDSPQPVDNDPDNTGTGPVDNASEGDAHAPGTTFPQVRPGAENASSVDQRTVGQPTESPATEDQPLGVQQRPARRSKEAFEKKTNKKTPPPKASPPVAVEQGPLIDPEVADAMQEILRRLPTVLLPRSAGQMEALVEALRPYLNAGWMPAQILQRAAYEPIPETVHSPAGFLRQRLTTLEIRPPATMATYPWCGECDVRTRQREDLVSGLPYRCTYCHPLALHGAEQGSVEGATGA